MQLHHQSHRFLFQMARKHRASRTAMTQLLFWVRGWIFSSTVKERSGIFSFSWKCNSVVSSWALSLCQQWRARFCAWIKFTRPTPTWKRSPFCFVFQNQGSLWWRSSFKKSFHVDVTIDASSSSAMVQVAMFIHQLKLQLQMGLHSVLQDKASLLFSSEVGHLKTLQTGQSSKINDDWIDSDSSYLLIFGELLVEHL